MTKKTIFDQCPGLSALRDGKIDEVHLEVCLMELARVVEHQRKQIAELERGSRKVMTVWKVEEDAETKNER